VTDGALVGASRPRDLVSPRRRATATAAPTSDARLVEAMRGCMAAEPWVPRTVVVEAVAGVLTLWGLVGTEAERAALETMARSIPGVRGADNQLVVHSALPSGL
jgi:osmotically-inducible protein OsmY